MTADIVWPARVLTPADAKASLYPNNTSGGTTFAGAEGVVGNTPGRWKITMKSIHLSSPAQVACWQAIEGILGGRAGTVLVPMFDYPRAPWPVVNGKRLTTYGGIPFDDGTLFDDGSGFYQPVIQASVVGAVAPGAVTCSIRVDFGGALGAGMSFSLGERGYRIRRVYSVDTTGDSPVYAIQFCLPAREAVPDGACAEFNDPMIRCRLATDDAMAIPDGLMLWRHASPSLLFVEDVGA